MECRRNVELKESRTASPVFEIVVSLKANNKMFILFQMELKQGLMRKI